MGYARLLQRPATYADIEALPDTWRGEIIDSELYAFPRPFGVHAPVESRITRALGNRFDGGDDPGGWWIVAEPAIQLPRAREVSPDVAGWTRARLPRYPTSGPVAIAPDWLCEILSPSTAGYDLVVKRRFYAEIGVRHLWYVDPRTRILTVSRLENGGWFEVGIHAADEKVRAEPFGAIEIDLAAWWEGLEAPPLEDEDREKLGE